MRTEGVYSMRYEPGETVVYPHHGAATILEVKKRKIKGEEQIFLKLKVHESKSPLGAVVQNKVHKNDLTIELPAESCELVGVRDVIDLDDVEEVFNVLRAPFTEEHSNWSRRYKANTEKLASGDVMKISEVVRDLWRRDQDRGLSTGEKSLLSKARQILISELALAKETNEEKASDILDEVLASEAVS